MFLNTLITLKDELTTVNENTTLEEALDLLEVTGFRCVPILDKSGKIFRGNIYKYHIYRHKSRGGDMTLPVTQLLKNATKFITDDSSFFELFFTLRDLPYISILDSNNHFKGIITHNSLMNIIKQSWGIDEGSFALVIKSSGNRGDLANISKIITRYTVILSCMSFTNDAKTFSQNIVFVLPKSFDKEKLDKLISTLNHKGYTISEIEDLKNI